MATIKELKEALITEQERAVQLSDRAFQAIDSVTNAANFWLTVLSIGLAVLGLFGLGAIFVGSRRAAIQIADKRIRSYLNSAEGQQFVKQAIETEVRSQIEQRAFLIVHPTAENGGNGFPMDPKAGEART